MKDKIIEYYKPLLHLLPAFIVAVIVVVAFATTTPILAEIPEELKPENVTASADAQIEDEKKSTSSDHTYEDGVYTGSAQGYGGLITVQVTVEDRKISEVEILDASAETESFLVRAEAVIDRVLEQQTWEVDVVSGATYSSKGILGAIQNALTGEAVENEAPATTEGNAAALSEEVFTDPDAYIDGVYTGSAQGYGGTITVQVTISGGVITKVDIISAAGETPSYLSRAQSLTTAIVQANSPNVDVVSGATYSSNGIINAVKRALAKAVSSGGDSDQDDDTDENDNEDPSNRKPGKDDKNDDEEFPDAEDGYIDGTYTGEGEGFGDIIQVEVTVRNGKIAAIKILDASGETPSYFKNARAVISAIIKADSPNVDAVSGATLSSNGIIDAVKDALKDAVRQKDNSDDGTDDDIDDNADDTDDSKDDNEDEEDHSDDDSDASEEEQGRYKDGTYSAQAICTDDFLFYYAVSVQLVVQNGQIAQISAQRVDDTSYDPEDNESYFQNALNGRTVGGRLRPGVATQVIEKQSADQVDTVSRATYSSNSLIQAIREILSQAAVNP